LPAVIGAADGVVASTVAVLAVAGSAVAVAVGLGDSAVAGLAVAGLQVDGSSNACHIIFNTCSFYSLKTQSYRKKFSASCLALFASLR
jgi:hypothetical protein